MTLFVESPHQCLEIIQTISAHKLAGVDTEFYGVDIRNQSCVNRSLIHVFSVAIPSGPVCALGFNETTDYVFPVTVQGYYNALQVPGVKEWLEDAFVTKPIHNQPVDSHSFANHGVRVRGGVNTLSYARWVYPHLARATNKPFALDNLAHWRLGLNKTESFTDLFKIKVQRTLMLPGIKKRCMCGELGCMKKKTPHDVKWPEEGIYEYTRQVEEYIPLTDLHPEHPLWARYLAYAGRDAVLALNMYQVMLRDGEKEKPYPWNPSWLGIAA